MLAEKQLKQPAAKPASVNRELCANATQPDNVKVTPNNALIYTRAAKIKEVSYTAPGKSKNFTIGTANLVILVSSSVSDSYRSHPLET